MSGTNECIVTANNSCCRQTKKGSVFQRSPTMTCRTKPRPATPGLALPCQASRGPAVLIYLINAASNLPNVPTPDFPPDVSGR